MTKIKLTRDQRKRQRQIARRIDRRQRERIPLRLASRHEERPTGGRKIYREREVQYYLDPGEPRPTDCRHQKTVNRVNRASNEKSPRRICSKRQMGDAKIIRCKPF